MAKHTMFLSISIVLTWLWTSTPSLNLYNLQLTGALTLLYFGFKFFSRPNNQKATNFTSTLILNTICLLLVFSTGGLSSPLFFLLDLLLFVLALLFEPRQATIASFLIVTLLLTQNYSQFDTTKIVNLISLVLMTPIAVVFSRNYLEVLQAKGRINVLEKVLEKTEADSLLWISATKPTVASILNSTTDLVVYFNSKSHELMVSPNVVDKLKSIQEDLITLYSSTGDLEKTIELESDNIKK